MAITLLIEKIDLLNPPQYCFVKTINGNEADFASTFLEIPLPERLAVLLRSVGGQVAAWPVHWMPTASALSEWLDRIPIIYFFDPPSIHNALANWLECREHAVIPLFQGETVYFARYSEPVWVEAIEDDDDEPQYALEHLLQNVYVCWDSILGSDLLPGCEDLVLAACRGDVAFLQKSIEAGHGIDTPLSSSGASLIYYSAINNQQAALRYLLHECSANPDVAVQLDSIQGKGESTTLVSVARLGKCTDVARMLLEAGADPNPKTPRDFPIFGKNIHGISIYSENLKPLLVSFGHQTK